MAESDLFHLPKRVETRWASMENPLAQPGTAGSANYGRKGSPCRGIKAGDSFILAQASGTSGMVRRIWVTISERTPALLRGLVLRICWDGQAKPAVEAPLGDFFGLALGRNAAFENAWFDNPEGRSFNCRIPMPFRTGFRMTVSNESGSDLGAFFYDVDFTVGDEYDDSAGYFHCHFHRESPTTLLHDFEILPLVKGRGRFLGCTIGVIADTETYGAAWWGEGEVKAYLDGDSALPTLCGTGTEDFIATGWGQGQFAHMWHGCPVADHARMQYSFYRLHGPDPVYFHKSARVTIQQIGGWQVKLALKHMREHNINAYLAPGDGKNWLTQEQVAAMNPEGFFLYERQDDWCATSYFYLDNSVDSLRAIQPYAERVAGLTGD
ncbi:MAG: glycoside hydrolase family 172 protein [Anaerolineae bacterium]